jgi:hypothetical protein
VGMKCKSEYNVANDVSYHAATAVKKHKHCVRIVCGLLCADCVAYLLLLVAYFIRVCTCICAALLFC